MWIQYIKGMAQRPRKKKQCTSFEDRGKRLPGVTSSQVSNKDICDACDECLEVINSAQEKIKEMENSEK